MEPGLDRGMSLAPQPVVQTDAAPAAHLWQDPGLAVSPHLDPRLDRRVDGWLVLVMLLMVPVAIYALKEMKRRVSRGDPLVQSDGANYFAYLPSVFFDRDLCFENDYAALGIDWQRRGGLLWRTPTGMVPNPWPVGTAMLWAPAYGASHVLTLLLRRAGYPLRADGRDLPYQAAALLATQAYVLVALVLLYRYLGQWFLRPICAMAVAGIFLGSFLLYYATLEASMSHGASFFGATLLLVLCRGSRLKGPRPFRLGLALGLLTSIRPEGVLFAGFPLESLVQACHREVPGWQRRLRSDALRLAAGLLLAMSPQLAIWHILYGKPLDPRGNLGFLHLGYAPVLSLLYSSRNGLLSWSPILVPASIGLIAMFRRDRRFALVALPTLVAFTYVLSVAADWWGGASFGARRFATCLPLLAVGLARSLEALVRRPRVATALLLGLFIVHNALDVESARRLPYAKDQTRSFRRLADARYRVLQRELGPLEMFPVGLILSWLDGVPPERVDEIWGTDLRLDLKERLEFEAPGEERYLGSGWSEPVSSAEGRSVCWVLGRAATVFVQLGPWGGSQLHGPRRMLLTLSALPWPCALDPLCRSSHARRPIDLDVFVNGRMTNRRRLPNRFGFRTLRLRLREPSPWVSGINVVRFVFRGGAPRGAPVALIDFSAEPRRAHGLGLDVPEARELLGRLWGWPQAPIAAVDCLVFR
jgi:hypothetical protein